MSEITRPAVAPEGWAARLSAATEQGPQPQNEISERDAVARRPKILYLDQNAWIARGAWDKTEHHLVRCVGADAAKNIRRADEIGRAGR